MRGRVLIIAGSDSGGGAGIQADIKTVTVLGGYAMTAVTALTAQNTLGVHGVLDVPPAFIRQQIRAVLSDIGADCIKIGMLHRADVVAAVADALAEMKGSVPVVVDPVMVAKGGHALLAADAVEVLRTKLLPSADLLTPNLPEAQALGGGSTEPPEALARRLLALGARSVLIKGGHGEGSILRDVLAHTDGRSTSFESSRLVTTDTHGTGCTLASAVATSMAQGFDIEAAVIRARAYVRQAIVAAPGFGHGHGPLNHGHCIRPFID